MNLNEKVDLAAAYAHTDGYAAQVAIGDENMLQAAEQTDVQRVEVPTKIIRAEGPAIPGDWFQTCPNCW